LYLDLSLLKMKRIDVAACIAGMLPDHPSVMIPGLGGFTATYAPAKVDQVLGHMQAPGLEVRFDENLAADDGLLSSCLVETYGIGYEEASAAIREFVRETQSALQQKNLVSFPKVGRLRLDFEGNIQFLPDAENLNPDSFGLPEIRFRPLKRSEPEPLPPTPASVAPARLRAPVSSGLVLGLAILAVTVTAYFLFRPQINALFSFRAEEEAPMERVNVAPPEPLREPSAETPDEEGAADTLEAPTLAPQQKQCIVVIGLFREKSNIDRLVQRIYAEGFEPYLEKNGAITRVGVQFPYTTEEDIAGPLRKVQSKLEAKAFVWKK
jgi:hypothetical protein